MTTSLTTLLTPTSKDDMVASILDVAQTVGLPITAWQPGSVGREIIEVLAQKMADLTQVVAIIAAGGLLDYAVALPDPSWIRILAKSLYGVDFIPATFGTTSVTLTNTSAVTYTPAVNDLHFVHSGTGKTYTNTTGGTLAAGGGVLTVDVVADEAGTPSNASVGTITALVTPLLGVTMTNAAALVASDDETSTDLATRCRAKLAAASPNGAADAYDYFARTAVRLTGGNVGVTRTKVVSTVSGSLILYVASAGGIVTGIFTDPTTDLGAVHANVQANCVPTGIGETTTSASPLSITVVTQVWTRHGSTATSAVVKAAVLAKLEAYFATLPIGGTDIGSGGQVFLDAIIGQIFQAHPDIVQAVITSPVADVAVAANEVPTSGTSLGDITVTAT